MWELSVDSFVHCYGCEACEGYFYEISTVNIVSRLISVAPLNLLMFWIIFYCWFDFFRIFFPSRHSHWTWQFFVVLQGGVRAKTKNVKHEKLFFRVHKIVKWNVKFQFRHCSVIQAHRKFCQKFFIFILWLFISLSAVTKVAPLKVEVK